MYTIGEIATIMNLSISTIRYYCNEGLLYNISRDSKGNRVFSDKDLDTLMMINCLKNSGMKIKEIKEFIDLCKMGDDSLNERLNFFLKKEQDVKKEIEMLNSTLLMIKYKKWYYTKAIEANDEGVIKNIKEDEIPDELKTIYKMFHN